MSQAPPHASNGKDQFTVCTQHCGARCCRYITVEIPTPLAACDWDEIRWWLAHEGVMVTRDEDGWMLHMDARCRNLQADNACAIYPHHMTTCKDYDPEICEYTGDVPFAVELRSEADLAAYLERRGLKRGARVAQEIRKAQALCRKKVAAAPAGARLVALGGLPRG